MNTFETEFGRGRLVVETGEFAKQSDGAALVRLGDTVVLATAVAEKKVREGLDFFPLTIDYQEKAYAAGKIPGGFFKREGRPSEKEVLTSRLIDRPLRPLFPEGFFSETQGIATLLSFGDENVSDVLGILGMSCALMLSDIPFGGPVGAVKVGYLNGQIILNPNLAEADSLELNITVAGTEDFIVMVEGGASEVSESLLLEAIETAHAEIKRLCRFQEEMREKAGRPKRELIPQPTDEELKRAIIDLCEKRIAECIVIPDKLKRQTELDLVRKEAVEKLNTPEADRSKEIAKAFFEIEKQQVRDMIVKKGVRADGRRPDEIRKIYGKVGFLPRAHGSALFVRGETQALCAATLGTGEDEQKIDALEGESYKRFMLHYNFPPFSVGEVKFLRGPGRREIGHGALAERAIKPMVPAKEEFPYTIRIVSDILESNGSSSMATVCASVLALMDAGVPIKSPVAGIAMGLVIEEDSVVILSDILGLEDHLGDMDFKVTGTEKGITAFQMDVKKAGINRAVLEEALNEAKAGRLHILGKMREVLSAPRENLAPYAPRIYVMHIKPEKIREVIGTGGKVIRGIVEETGVKIDIDDTGLVNIASNDEASAMKAKAIIEGIVAEAELGKVYEGKVVRIAEFGAFVEIMPGIDGLVHISQISHKRIAKVTDVLHEGDMVTVKVIEIDKQGRVRLSRKEILKPGED
ncbi:MAG: polyribonucleotide nucleotidyltransferase [Nitrospiraceae bacterium]|nr:polyribonucleotide nucleotidyltransferase [Nitrospiraceae bacterium]